MKLTTKQPEPTKPNVILELSHREFEVLRATLGIIIRDGVPEEVGDLTRNIYELGREQGFNKYFTELFPLSSVLYLDANK